MHRSGFIENLDGPTGQGSTGVGEGAPKAKELEHLELLLNQDTASSLYLILVSFELDSPERISAIKNAQDLSKESIEEQLQMHSILLEDCKKLQKEVGSIIQELEVPDKPKIFQSRPWGEK